MATNGGNSYEYSNTIRSVNNQFDIIREKSQVLFTSLITRGMDTKHYKHEWIEDKLSATRSAIGSFDTDGDGTGVNVASTTGFRAGMILGVEKATGASVTEQLRVVSVDSATDMTLSRDYGSTTGVTLVVGDVLFVISEPKGESSKARVGSGYEGVLNYNFCEIFDGVAQVSKTSQAIEMYGLMKALEMAEMKEMADLNYRLNNAVILGTRVQRSGSADGTMGGILSYLAGGNVDTTGGAISTTILNNLFESVLTDGGFSNRYAILCNYNQARKISAFNTSGTNPVTQVMTDSQRAGRAISEFYGDIPVSNGQLGTGFRAFIAPDPNFPKDKIALIDLDRVTLRNLVGREFTSSPANNNGDDYFATRILGELTLEVKNGKTAHAIATGLTL